MKRISGIIASTLVGVFVMTGPAYAQNNVTSRDDCSMGKFKNSKVYAAANWDETHLDSTKEVIIATLDKVVVKSKRKLDKVIVQSFNVYDPYDTTFVDYNPKNKKDKKGYYVNSYDFFNIQNPIYDNVIYINVIGYTQWKKKDRHCAATLAVYNEIY